MGKHITVALPACSRHSFPGRPGPSGWNTIVLIA